MTLPFHPRPDDPDADRLNTFLDAMRSGVRAPDAASSESTEAAALAGAAGQLRGLVRRADAPAAAYLDDHPLQNRWESIMSTAFPAEAPNTVTGEAFAPSAPVSNRRRRAVMPQPPPRLNAWHSAAIVAVMLLGTIGGAWWLGPGGSGPTGDRTRLAAVTQDDSTPDAIWPEPLTPEEAPWVAAIEPEECDIEPLPYEDYAKAVTTDPGGIPDRSYEIVGPADPEDSQAAVGVLRGWMACGDLSNADQVRAYSTSDLLFFQNYTTDNAAYQEEIDRVRAEVEQQWTLWAIEQDLYPIAMVDGVVPPDAALDMWEYSRIVLESDGGPTVPRTFYEARFNPDDAVLLRDGRLMLPTTYVYFADDPWVGAYGFSPEPNMKTAAVVMKQVDGEWKIDESAIWICIGECADVLAGTGTPVASPDATPVD
jgi:hypothetical protein